MSRFESKTSRICRYCLSLLPGFLATTFLLALAGDPAWAGATQNHDDITAAVESMCQENAAQRGFPNAAVVVHAIDERLSLPHCDAALAAFPTRADQVVGAMPVGVRCAGSAPWTIYVRADVNAGRSVPVLSKPLAARSIIAADDIAMAKIPAQALTNGIILERQELIGMELTRALDAGSPVRVSQIRLPKLVKRGQQVTLVSGGNGVEVQVQGKALSDGAAGDRVQVMNLSSGNKVEGVVTDAGAVRVY